MSIEIIIVLAVVVVGVALILISHKKGNSNITAGVQEIANKIDLSKKVDEVKTQITAEITDKVNAVHNAISSDINDVYGKVDELHSKVDALKKQATEEVKKTV